MQSSWNFKKIEYEFEDAITQEEGMSNKGDINQELSELPSDNVND